MFFRRIRNFLRFHPIKPTGFVAVMSIIVIVLSWPFPMFFEASKIQLFNIPLIYFYIILIGPALILFVTNWAAKFCDNLDRKQLETEND